MTDSLIGFHVCSRAHNGPKSDIPPCPKTCTQTATSQMWLPVRNQERTSALTFLDS